MSALADPRRFNGAATLAVPGLLVLVVLIAVTGLALRGSSRAAQQPYGQLVAQAAAGELVAGSQAGQTFRTDQSGLNRIDVYFGNSQRQNHGPLVLHVSAAPFAGPDLARAAAEAAQLPADGFMVFEFSPLPAAAGHPLAFLLGSARARAAAEAAQLRADGFMVFEFSPLPAAAGQPLAFWLEAPEARAGNALTPMGAAQDVYPGGAAVFADMPAGRGVRDLAFKLYYQSGWLGALGVLFARQAADRPGIFGLPQLYAALLLAYLLGLAGLLAVAAKRLRLCPARARPG